MLQYARVLPYVVVCEVDFLHHLDDLSVLLQGKV
jgi:hypothetical protein